MTLPLVIDVAHLQRALDGEPAAARDRLRLFDLRARDAYLDGHIPGAMHLDARLLNHTAPPYAGLLPDEAGMQELIEAMDLCAGDHVIAIDGGRATEAARLTWVLQVWGFTAISWLNGGMRAWTSAGATLVPGDSNKDATATSGSDRTAPRFQPVLDGANRATADDLAAELEDPELRILDVRGRAEFDGSDKRSAEGGHVPGALHFEWTTLLDANGQLLPDEQLLAALRAADVEPHHRVVAYCQSHQRSSVTWLVLRKLGFTHVRGLDGAWSVWGNRPDLPKET